MNRLTVLVIVTTACLAGCGGDASEVGEAKQRLEETEELPGGSPAASSTAAAGACEVIDADMPLPDEVRETSGLARSTRDPGVFWTHNDAGNDPELFAFDRDGRLIQRVVVTGSELVDWEDLESAPCGDGGACLYVGDIGDNDAERDHITIYRVPEPGARDTRTAPAEALHARFPDGPRDAEALFAARSGDLYIITKGRAEEIGLYRYPAPQRPTGTVTLERVRTLFPAPRDGGDRVTAATSTPDGRWVGVRTNRRLYLYPARALLSAGPAGAGETGTDAVEPITIDLSPLAEPQGEALAMADDGAVWVSSEADDEGPRWSRLRCSLPTAERGDTSDDPPDGLARIADSR